MANLLKDGDELELMGIKYRVVGSEQEAVLKDPTRSGNIFLSNKSGGSNDKIFRKLGLDKYKFVRDKLGKPNYPTYCDWPYMRSFADLTKVVKSLQTKIKAAT